MIVMENVSKEYKNGVHALRDISILPLMMENLCTSSDRPAQVNLH